jgi:F-type H+-transporting ATPase subunit b
MQILVSQILFQIVNFSVVVGLLTYLLYKPVLKIFEERAKRIEEGQKAAEAALVQQERIEELKATAKKEMKKEKAAILEAATAEAKEQKQQILTEAKEEAAKLIAEMQTKFEEEQAQRMNEMQQEIIEAVVTATERVIGQKLTAKDQAALIDKELNTILKSL